MTLRWFSGRVSAIVASVAHTCTVTVMSPRATNEGCGGMARAAIQVGRNVGGIGLCIHTGCRNTMTRVAPCTVGNGTVVKRCRDKAAGGMTDTTILVSLNVAIYFTLG